MQTIQLADDVYDRARRLADEAGFESVDEYVTIMLADDGVRRVGAPLLTRATRLAVLEKW